ncbi:MAG: DCC1-like thiol-disulfide oxidoreductase family protein [Henriciella sp.]
MSALDPSALSQEKASSDNWLIYDGECPFCSQYVKLVRIREAVGGLKLLNAREGGPQYDEVLRAGLDLDEGMVLKLNDRLYHGDDCIHALAMLSEPKGFFNRLNVWVFKSPKRAAFLYPILRAGRNLALKLLGRKKLDHEEATS